jgi:hypothetical protein
VVAWAHACQGRPSAMPCLQRGLSLPPLLVPVPLALPSSTVQPKWWQHRCSSLTWACRPAAGVPSSDMSSHHTHSCAARCWLGSWAGLAARLLRGGCCQNGCPKANNAHARQGGAGVQRCYNQQTSGQKATVGALCAPPCWRQRRALALPAWLHPGCKLPAWPILKTRPRAVA